MRKITVLLVLLTSMTTIVSAQDTHYWTQQFGTRSALLSGAVLGEYQDNTMIYYNPGALGFIENSSISINANAYTIESIKVENALGEQADFKSAQVGSIPLLAGGMISKENSEWKIGYAFINPVGFNFKGVARVDGNFDIIDDTESAGLEETVAEASINSKTSELTFAVGLGKKFNDRLSIGLSNLFTVRSHSYQRALSTYSFMNDGNSTLVGGNLTQNADYYNVRYAAKLGMIYQMGKWNTGLTVTLPSINLFGNGTVAANIAARNLMLIDDERISGVATDRQAKLKSKFKSPLSIALGTNYSAEKSSFGIAAQYYFGIDEYQILNPLPGSFVRPAELAPQLQSDDFLRLRSAAKSVLNVAVGYEYKLDESLSILASVRNDMSYFDEDINDGPGIKSSISSWNIYHFTAGVTMKRKTSSLSLGLLFSTGSDNRYEQSGAFNPDDLDLVEGTTTLTNATYSNIGLLLGYTFYLRKFQFDNEGDN